MRKVLIGCGILLIIFVIAVAISCYKLFQVASGFKGKLETATTDLKATNDRYAFFQPADGKVSDEQFVKWLAVRKSVAQVDVQSGFNQSKPNLRDIMNAAFGAFTKPLVALSSGLTDQKMALREYMYITGQVYGTLTSNNAPSTPEALEMARFYNTMSRNISLPTQGQQTKASLDDLANTVTAAEAEHYMILLIAHKQDFMSSQKAGYADLMLSFLKNSSLGGANLGLTPRQAGQSASAPASLPATTAPATAPATSPVEAMP